MLNAIKRGHVEFAVRDLSRMSDFYQEVIGLVETGRAADAVHLSAMVGHSSVVPASGQQDRAGED